MSRCVHEQCKAQVRKLPRCSRCKQQLMLVAASYGQRGKTELEWECGKCGKAIAAHLLREEEPTDFEKFLSSRGKNGTKNKEKEKNSTRKNRPRRRKRNRS